ncbi:hypothetical protein MSG28_014462 [Choristoneura fumiferana]|uniref:Uncharacterized protein n=1 Tax=Choristoneura fumiferana TaxID=7141 RepID=A0ACC0JRV3_CHOFU|nr:hypothetical protein MSG28_014462 [Choristoneura fumiferana]
MDALSRSLHTPHLSASADDGRDMYCVRAVHEYRIALAQLKAQGITHIIVDTDPRRLRQLARADMELFDLEDFYYNRVNMSGWRLVDRDSDKVKDALLVMEKFHPIGASIISGGHIKLMRLVGGEKGRTVVSGHWSPSGGLAITDPAAYKRDPPPNVTLTIVTVEEKPYVMVKEGWNLAGNARFEGFCIDLLARVAAQAGFAYRLRLVPDNMYGARDPDTGQWNGIVRELMDRVC